MKTTACSYISKVTGIRRKIRHFLFLSVFISLLFPSYSVRAADLLEIYNLAVENDPKFQSASYKYGASPEIYRQARAELLPSLIADGSYQRTKQRIEDTNVAVFGANMARYPSKGYTLTLNQPIFRYSSIMRLLQSREEVKQAELEFELAKQDLILRVSEAYIGVLAARDSLEFTIAEEDALKLHYELAKERYSNGLAPITDFHDAKARLTYTTAQRTLAENTLDDAFEALAEITGQKILHISRLPVTVVTTDSSVDQSAPSDDVLPLQNPDPDDLDQWLNAALEQNLGILIKKQEVLVAGREIDRQRGGHMPNVALVGRLNRDDEGGSLYGGDSDVMTREAIIQLNIPIFQGFSVQSKVNEARELHQAAKQELEKEVRTANRVVRSSFLGVKGSIENTTALRESVISTMIALEAKREGFRSGLYPSLAVLDAERDLHRSRQEYARARYDYILYSLQLKKEVGNLTEADIIEINQWFDKS
ncbi:MAG: TolC family outer membrane protein [Deltaproteobacteria bacterium]|nr:TolC family outer membrane protein [Deltaproteobacteria bacterium]